MVHDRGGWYEWCLDAVAREGGPFAELVRKEREGSEEARFAVRITAMMNVNTEPEADETSWSISKRYRICWIFRY